MQQYLKTENNNFLCLRKRLFQDKQGNFLRYVESPKEFSYLVSVLSPVSEQESASITPCSKPKTATVEELKGRINKIQSIIYKKENNIANKNNIILYEEICNLLDSVGVTNSDYYAPVRLYSQITGVKNIRFGYDNTIVVKIVSPSGYLLPEKISVRGEIYSIEFILSKKYEERLDY